MGNGQTRSAPSQTRMIENITFGKKLMRMLISKATPVNTEVANLHISEYLKHSYMFYYVIFIVVLIFNMIGERYTHYLNNIPAY